MKGWGLRGLAPLKSGPCLFSPVTFVLRAPMPALLFSVSPMILLLALTPSLLFFYLGKNGNQFAHFQEIVEELGCLWNYMEQRTTAVVCPAHLSVLYLSFQFWHLFFLDFLFVLLNPITFIFVDLNLKLSKGMLSIFPALGS